MKKIIFFIVVILTFQGCSWQEYFVIINQTNSDITIEYEIEQPKSGFAIFDNRQTIHKLSKNGDIDWNETLEVNDLDTSRFIIKLLLAPNTVVTIGNLSNDTYKKHDQYFINGRTFNLKNLKILNSKPIIEITPENFDNFFVKKNGIIALRLK
ncbi:MAG: hypothetical protein Q7W45_02555 [Bacteroidota bacterium]|nr:hypothetical protein [Bacteroidota bacterium]MDP3145866.1 hypothetical protein [Bacteroidota bacterium]MDP3558500.1 hypothetical protein [Bacteroidota bacterium]